MSKFGVQSSEFRVWKKVLPIFIFPLLFTINYQLSTCYAASDIANVEKLFLEARYDKVISESAKLIDARSRQRDELYYLKGLSELKTDRFADARRSFESILAKYARSKRAFDAAVGIGDSYFLENRYDEAVKSYNEVLAKFPKDKNIGIIPERINNCHKKTTNTVTEEPAEKHFIPQEVPRGEKSSAISVQVGSFKNKRNADKLSAKLHGMGYESFVEIPAGIGDKLYRVKVGRLGSKEEAEALAKRLKRSGYKVKICSD